MEMSNKDAWFFLWHGLAWYVSGAVMLASSYLEQSIWGIAVLSVAMLYFAALTALSFFSVCLWPIFFAVHWAQKWTKDYDLALVWVTGVVCLLCFVAAYSINEENLRWAVSIMKQIRG